MYMYKSSANFVDFVCQPLMYTNTISLQCSY